MNEPLLSIQDLRVEYRTTEETVNAVNGICIEVNKGETLGFVGESGAGKTTTALAIMRLLPERTGKITSGKIIFDGRDLLKIHEEEMRYSIRGERIAMIFQDPMTSLNPVMTVGFQIEEAIKYHDEKITTEEMQARVEEVLELVGIPKYRKNEYPHQFSGGMRQRVVIAMALACKPELLIADEPTTALDVTIQAQVLALMDDLRERLGMAMIIITHDLGIVTRTCDRVAVMYAGRIVESGTLEDVFTGNKHHPYTVGLFNAIPSLIKETDRLQAIDGLMPDPSDLPDGCAFAERCAYCTEECKHSPLNVYSCGSHKIECTLYKNEEAKEVLE